MGFPITTTSVNEVDKAFMTSQDDLDHKIRAKVDFLIDEGEIDGKPSAIVNLEGEEVKIRER
jgi:tRNA A37 threonylcarbamoyladenosine synthetase subunit TsaC/SUA5/YrdC